jgi:phosphodiesterase/alkaline phosphatase D-like protein
MQAAQGKVTLVGVPEANLTSTSAVVSFVAPDSTGCPVDYSSSDAAVMTTFTRVSDAGGARPRNIALPGLTPGTVYHYRVNCAVEQPTGQFRTH